MKFINIKTNRTANELLLMIRDNARVNSGVKFADKKGGKPFMHVKEKGSRLRIKCEMMGRPTKDNAFLMGTEFYGSITEKNGETTLKGVIMTSPIYHAVTLILAIAIIAQMIYSSNLSSIPILVFAVAFEFMFFADEFKKQGYISRYLERAVRRLEQN
jgi:hypothetical protein